MVNLLIDGVLAAFILVTLAFTLVIVKQQTTVVIERLGKFNRMMAPGLRFKIPYIEAVTYRISQRVRQLDVRVETKTKDNVFVHVTVSVQYWVEVEQVWDAAYKLTRPDDQITSFVFDVVRARVPTIKLDDVFEKKDDIADAVKAELTDQMAELGYSILRALVTDIEPDAVVKEAMNEINAAQRLRVAATEKGEADRILRVKAAEGEAQSKALQGKGIADQRIAIVEGLRASVADFQEGVPGSSPQDVMNLVLMTQYFDTLKDVAEASETNTILTPHTPANMTDLSRQMQDALITADQVAKAGNGKARSLDVE